MPNKETHLLSPPFEDKTHHVLVNTRGGGRTLHRVIMSPPSSSVIRNDPLSPPPPPPLSQAKDITRSASLKLDLPPTLLNNGSAWAHVFLTKTGLSPNPTVSSPLPPFAA